MIYVLVPVFNEEDNIPHLIANLDAALQKMGETYRLIFVNDGSTDGTANVIREHGEKYPLEMLGNNPNQGVGVSFDKGFKYFIAQGKTDDILVTMEGDNTSDLNTLPKLIASIREGKDFALASVYADGGHLKGLNFERKFLSIGANILCSLIFQMKGVHTYSSFYRAYSYSALEELYQRFNNRVILEKGYSCMAEVLLKLYHCGFSFEEMPTTLHYNKRIGLSKQKKWETIRAYLRILIQYILSDKSDYNPKSKS